MKMKNTKNLTIVMPLIFLLCSCQTSFHTKVSNKENSVTNDPSRTIVSTYSGGQVILKDANAELDKLIAKNEKLKGLTFDKLSSDQKEAIIKEVVLKEMAYKEAKKKKVR